VVIPTVAVALGVVMSTGAAAGPAEARVGGERGDGPGAVPASSFVVARGPRLMLGQRPFEFVGANLAITHGPESRASVGVVLDGAAADGVRVGRVWAFGEGLADASPWVRANFLFRAGPDDWIEAAARHLDLVLAEAGRRGIRLIITLANQWSDYGGVPRYLEWFAGAPAADRAGAGDPAPAAAFGAADRFYSDARTRSAYRAHLERLLQRTNTVTGVAYRDDPTILAWELMNESRVATAAGARARRAWIREMAALVHRRDRRHLVMSGVSGYRLGRERDAWLRSCQLPEVDICDGHLYPEEALRDRDDAAVDAAIDDLVQLSQFVARKPFILGEFGFQGEAAVPGGGGAATGSWRGASRAAWVARVLERLRLDGAAGGLVWIYQRPGGADRVHGISVGGPPSPLPTSPEPARPGDRPPADAASSAVAAAPGGPSVATSTSASPSAAASASASPSAAVRAAIRSAAAALVTSGGGDEAAHAANPLLGRARGTRPILALHAEVIGTAAIVARPEPGSTEASEGRRVDAPGLRLSWAPETFARADWEASGFYAGGVLRHVWGTATGWFEYAFELPPAPPGAEARRVPAALELRARLSSEFPGDVSPPDGASAFVVSLDGLRVGDGIAPRDDGKGAFVTVRSTRAEVLRRAVAPGRHALRIAVRPGSRANGLCIYGGAGAKPELGLAAAPVPAPARVELRLTGPLVR
jgi:mannan endo-1,4-beta-mannosidase